MLDLSRIFFRQNFADGGLCDASEQSLIVALWRLVWICDMRHRRTAPGGFIHGKPASAISGHPDIPCFLLLDDSLPSKL